MRIALIPLLLTSLVAGCSPSRNDNSHTTATTMVTPPPTQILRIVSRPASIAAMMKERGAEEDARPVVKILSPSMNSVVAGPTVWLKLSLSGDLQGYKLYQDSATGMGNHLHVILDNEPYEACYDLSRPFALHDVKPGKHTLRVFAARPWHESYKNDSSFAMVAFSISDDQGSAQAQATRIDAEKPLLSYSRPRGEYKGDDADPIMIDFWLSNAKLKGDGGEFRVRYFVDDDDARYIDRWEPIWLAGWTSGKHTVRMELLGADQWPVKSNAYNITTHEITLSK